MALKLMKAESAWSLKGGSFMKLSSLIMKRPENFTAVNEAPRSYQACLPLLQSCHEFTTSSSVASVFCQKECLNVTKLNRTVQNKPSQHCFQQSRLYGTENPHFISKFSEEIDIEELREQRKREKLLKGTNMSVSQLVKETIAEKCDMALANLTKEEKKKLQIIQLEHDFLYSEGNLIPSAEEMTSENWLEAMNRPSKNQRLKYYIAVSRKNHLKETSKEAARKKKEQRMQERAMVTKTETYEHGRIFMRIYETQMKRALLHNLGRSMQFGLPLVLDMDYAEHMRPQELRNTSKQLMDLYSYNRSDSQMPFHLHFTGCPDDNPIYRHFQMLMHDDPNLLITVTEKSYLDLFDRKDLVYLSPNGRQVMREFNPDSVYIIGAFNDKASQKHISYARSKEQNIKCQRLPLDEYLVWNLGNKDLTLNQMMLILRGLKNNASWEEALKAVPKRKIRDRLR